jgi:hypothetical protein
MFVIGVTIDAGEDRTPGQGLDHCGLRVMMDVPEVHAKSK